MSRQMLYEVCVRLLERNRDQIFGFRLNAWWSAGVSGRLGSSHL